MRESVFPRKRASPAVSFVSFLQEKKTYPPSFLFRRKEAKENHLRNSFLSALLLLSLTCYTKRTIHIRTVRFSLPNRTCGKTSFLRKTSSPAVSFVSFLQEKKTYPFKKRNRSPLEEKKSFPQRAPSYLPKMRSSSDGGSVAFGTKAGAAVASDGAAAGVGAASAGPP